MFFQIFLVAFTIWNGLVSAAGDSIAHETDIAVVFDVGCLSDDDCAYHEQFLYDMTDKLFNVDFVRMAYIAYSDVATVVSSFSSNWNSDKNDLLSQVSGLDCCSGGVSDTHDCRAGIDAAMNLFMSESSDDTDRTILLITNCDCTTNVCKSYAGLLRQMNIDVYVVNVGSVPPNESQCIASNMFYAMSAQFYEYICDDLASLFYSEPTSKPVTKPETGGVTYQFVRRIED